MSILFISAQEFILASQQAILLKIVYLKTKILYSKNGGGAICKIKKICQNVVYKIKYKSKTKNIYQLNKNTKFLIVPAAVLVLCVYIL